MSIRRNIYIYIYIYRGAFGVIAIVVGNGPGDRSSNHVCISPNANTLGKGITPSYSSFSYEQIVGQTVLFNLGMATDLEKGKF